MKPKTRLARQPLAWANGICFGIGLALVLIAAAEALSVGWGSGSFVAKLSLKWTLALAGLYALGALLLAGLFLAIYLPKRWAGLVKVFLQIRRRLIGWRLALAGVTIVLPAWFAFYSAWGGLFTGLFFRIVLFAIAAGVAGVLLTTENKTLIEWKPLLLGGVLIGSALVLAESFVLVTDYPFALHWSEGNRLWDYSVLFGGERFNYPITEGPIYAFIDQGRQTLWGLPFLIPNIGIFAVRLWGALLVTVPYAILGWVAFRPENERYEEWLIVGLWAMVFLNQGPIYTPLVLAAIVVAFARRKPWWLALPLVYFAGDYAGSSRLTWRFAAGIWAVMLTFGDSVILFGKLRWQDWLRATALGLAGIWTKGVPVVAGIVIGLLPLLAASTANAVVQPENIPMNVEDLQGLQVVTTTHPFLWERLLPNGIYPPGIILGLAFATLPVILLTVHLIKKGYWKTEKWQLFATALGLAAFLVVGVIASAKIGGGTDLHNLDMFFIGLLLVAGLAWEGLSKRFSKLLREHVVVRSLLVAVVFIPAFLPMVEGKPLQLPREERTQFVLNRVQAFVACARDHGEVLFMDQRQLLTFGEMGDLPLVVEYEKKFVMDKALEGNEVYFAEFNEDLESRRFSLIVTERSSTLYKAKDIDSIGDSLIEENNAWVRWVTTPLLANYESVADFRDAAIELFMPLGRNFACP